MLKIYDQNHNQLGMLTKYKDLKQEGVLSSADKTLSFTVLDPDEIPLNNEYYVRTRTDEFVIKKISRKSWTGMTVTCLLNLEGLQGNPFESFTVSGRSLADTADLALAGTGWSVGACNVDKIRSVGMVDCNSLQVIDNLCIAWMCDHSFDTLNKKVNFYNRMGSNRGAYFIDGLNLKRVTRETDTYDYYTRIIPIGAEGLTIESVNNGKKYLENYQYSSKVLTCIWKDETYTDPHTLMEDAEAKLKEISQPVESYSCDIVDLARQRKDYEFLSYSLGDEIRLINRETRTLTRRRITKMVEYPETPEKNTCEFSNVVLTFTEMQEKLKRAADIVNYIVTSDGKISVSDILNFEKGVANSSSTQMINADLELMRDALSEMEHTIDGFSMVYAEIGKANIPSGWVDTEMLEQGSVTAEKADISGIAEAIFSSVIVGPEFVDAYLQNPTITGATIDADTLTVAGKDVLQLLEDLDAETNEQRISALEKKVTNIIAALANVIADDPAE